MLISIKKIFEQYLSLRFNREYQQLRTFIYFGTIIEKSWVKIKDSIFKCDLQQASIIKGSPIFLWKNLAFTIFINLFRAYLMAPKLTIDDLSALFEPDNIRDGKSVQNLASWEGYAGLQKSLRTNFQRGIITDPKDHEKRVDEWGDNLPIIKPPKTITELILENFEDDMLRILCASAVVSLVLGIATEGLKEGWLEGASILLAVIIIVSVTSTNNYLKQKQFQKLNALATAKNINVIRGGQLLNISVYDLLVGDVCEIETGEILSVDGILIEGHNLSCDQSSITGEIIDVKKRVPKTFEADEGASPFLISSSKVMEGTGLMVVAAVGKNSYYGKLKMKIQAADDTTPLQEKLTVLADQVGVVGMYSAAATFIAMFVHYVYDCTQTDNFIGSLISVETLHEIIQYFIIAVSIVVVAVPEGLPLAVTIALAYSVNKMKDENNLVRYLQACETMGGANNICSDKTGTLTKNLMTVTKIFIEQNVNDSIEADIAREHTIRLLCLSVCNNTSASPTIARQGTEITNNQVGNKTECALLEMAFRMGYDYKKFRNKDNQSRIFPFSSEKKKMATCFSDEKGINYVFVKGAPDFLLEHCTKFINKSGNVSKINSDFIASIKETIENFASESLRTILLTYKEVSETPESWDDIENDLIIIGMVGIKDPLREGIKKAVEACHTAGVRVRMVTGDNKNTAIAIAKQAGILPSDWQPSEGIDTTVMQGKVFREFVGGLVKEGEGDDAVETVGNMDNFIQVANNLCVLARSSPDDKYLMATGLKQLGNVVAMTGDGTNDAPALKKADIGFAMGIAGTEVAKEASGIILLDDNFSSIVTAMKWGRNIFDCIRKFLQFQLTVNFVALVMAFVGGAVLRESPLNPIQMLWVNLIMDTLASLALATEPPTDELLTRKPYSRNESLITANMWKNIICQGLMQIGVLGTILFKGPEILGIPSSIGVNDWNEETGKHYSIFFNVFVLLQIFNEINARKLKHSEANVFQNFLNNPLFLVILVSTIVIQLTMVKYGGKSLKTVELSFKENLLCIILGTFSLIAGLLIKTFLPENLIVSPKGIEIGSFSYYWNKSKDEKEE